MEIPSTWTIATVAEPTTFTNGSEESWFLNPVRRYVFNALHVPHLAPHLETLSSVQGQPGYRPLNVGAPLAGARILVERFRGRGIGDLLFLTGPFNFMHQATGGDVHIDLYAFADRGLVLQGNPLLKHRTALLGPTHFDDFPRYRSQWLVDNVTESTEEDDQMNVYDALFTQLGLNPAEVDPKFKRPSVAIEPADLRDALQVQHSLWSDRHFDVRHTGYYVVAPFTHSALRSAPYQLWLDVIKELAHTRPVFVVGQLHAGLPVMDMTPDEFLGQLNGGGNVVNLTGLELPLRTVMALISQATAFVGLDSGLLYVAQGCRVPAVSLWGPHDPGVRIGYDPDYMDLAIWQQAACDSAACFAYRGFPAHKCPQREKQRICSVLHSVTVKDVLAKVTMVEDRRVQALRIRVPQK